MNDETIYEIIYGADLFCGAGGTTTGLCRTCRKLGRKLIMLALNHWKVAVASHKANYPDVQHICPARDIINWGLTGKSIFTRKKPLSPNTLRRIAAGMKKFCGVDLEPFFVMMYGTGKARSVKLPLPTVTANGQHIALCEPFVLGQQSCSAPRSVKKPIPTVATAGAISLIEPFIVPYFGERKDQLPRIHSIKKPLPTVTGHGAGALVEPFIVCIDHTGGNSKSIRSIKKPLATITTKNRMVLCQPWILPNEGYYRGNKPRSIDRPLPTITAGRGGGRVVMPFIVEVNHSDNKNSNPAVRTHSIDDPLPTITTHNGKAMVEPYLVEYYGQGKAKSIHKPLPTVTTHDRFALVEPVPVINGEQKLYLDIRLRMLTPQELAAAMGFPSSYKFTGTKTETVKQIGNAVQIDLAEKLTYAVLSHHLKTNRRRW